LSRLPVDDLGRALARRFGPVAGIQQPGRVYQSAKRPAQFVRDRCDELVFASIELLPPTEN